MNTRKAQRGYLTKSRTVDRSPEGLYKTIIKRKEGPAGRSESIREKRTLKGILKRVPKTSEWMNRVEDNIPPSEGMPVSKNGGKTPAWQRKEGKSPSGGLNAKGRASLKAAGHDIKAPQPQGGPRKKSFCARSAGQMKMWPKAAKDPNSRLRLARKKWKC